MNQKIQKIAEEMQPLVDSLKEIPQYSRYVEERKLHLINSSLQEVDDLLTAGVLK